ncbi:MAG TPA: Holliday junction resolvase RuvX [Amnibacterium sp.]|nr:Holliday junction resolvase RuvX [Amnibacterium sp.]
MRHGVRLGVDVGTVRVGVARSDPDGLLATPLETVQRGADIAPVVARVQALAAELDAVELIVGLPLSLRGTDTASTGDARRVAALLADGERPVRLVDERLTTVSAQSALHASGRNTRGSRRVIDQVAAVILLQHALDAERARGEAPGTLVDSNRK